jgi:hypothetical protein
MTKLEKLVMRSLKFNEDPMLSALPYCHDTVTACRARCKELLAAQAAQLDEYAALYSCYTPLLSTHLPSYLGDHARVKEEQCGRGGGGGQGGAVSEIGLFLSGS